MDRRFMLWFGWPFIGLVVITIGLGFLAPNLLVAYVAIMLFVLAAVGLLGSIGYAIIQIRAGNSWAEALNPIATLLVVVGLSFGAQFLGIGRSPQTESVQSNEPPQISPGIKLATIQDGYFRSTAVIGSQTVPFIVDFKTEHLLLKQEDAKRLGIDTASLTYDRDVMIKGRSVKGAMVTLPSLQIASASISNTPAIVISDPMPENVIGIRPLHQFGDWHIEPAGLILSPAN
jgi:aspartyl protease family protein